MHGVLADRLPGRLEAPLNQAIATLRGPRLPDRRRDLPVAVGLRRCDGRSVGRVARALRREHALLPRANYEWGTILSINVYTWMCVGSCVDPAEIFEEAVGRADALGTQVEHGMALRNFGSYLSRKGETEEARATLALA